MIRRTLSCIPNYIYVEKVILIITFSFWVLSALLITKRIKKTTFCRCLGVVIIICWCTVLFLETMYGRNVSGCFNVELRPFWCLKEAWLNSNCNAWYLLLANILLFIPIGIAAPLIFYKLRNYNKIIVLSMVLSLLIESLQLISCLGLFELDDLINNMIGGILGYGIFVVVKKMLGGHIPKKDVIIAVLSWTLLLLFLVIAIIMGQPVFGYFR